MTASRTPGRKALLPILAAAVLPMLAASPALAADVEVGKAWVPPTGAVGSDVVLSMTIANKGAAADALLRAACPFANFSEKRTVDRGEGAPSKRAIPNIPVPANASVTLEATGYHVALLQTREPLKEGAEFTCSLSFRGAGAMQVKVRVATSPPSE